MPENHLCVCVDAKAHVTMRPLEHRAELPVKPDVEKVSRPKPEAASHRCVYEFTP
jgi:hypothetical protein